MEDFERVFLLLQIIKIRVSSLIFEKPIQGIRVQCYSFVMTSIRGRDKKKRKERKNAGMVRVSWFGVVPLFFLFSQKKKKPQKLRIQKSLEQLQVANKVSIKLYAYMKKTKFMGIYYIKVLGKELAQTNDEMRWIEVTLSLPRVVGKKRAIPSASHHHHHQSYGALLHHYHHHHLLLLLYLRKPARPPCDLCVRVCMCCRVKDLATYYFIHDLLVIFIEFDHYYSYILHVITTFLNIHVIITTITNNSVFMFIYFLFYKEWENKYSYIHKSRGTRQ